MLVFAYMYFYRVTSHPKAMEDAVEIGLRSAFNEVGFTSFSKALPGLKLRGEHLSPSCGAWLIAYMRLSQPGNRLYPITSPTSFTNSLRRLLRGIMSTTVQR